MLRVSDGQTASYGRKTMLKQTKPQPENICDDLSSAVLINVLLHGSDHSL